MYVNATVVSEKLCDCAKADNIFCVVESSVMLAVHMHNFESILWLRR